MLAAKPSRQSSAVWQGSTKDGYTLRLTRSRLTQIISKLKQTGLEHLVYSLRSNNQVSLEGAVVPSIAQVVNHATASGTVSSQEFGTNLRAFIAIGKTRKYQILTQPIDRKQSAIIFVRSTPIQKIENEFEYEGEYEGEGEGEYENEYKGKYKGEYEGKYEGEYEGEFENSPSRSRRRSRSLPPRPTARSLQRRASTGSMPLSPTERSKKYLENLAKFNKTHPTNSHKTKVINNTRRPPGTGYNAVGKKKNIAFADVNLAGHAPRRIIAASGDPHQPFFRATRKSDSEQKILDQLARSTGTSNDGVPDLKVRGSVHLYSEREPCPSCKGIIKQFGKKFPKTKLTVEHGPMWGPKRRQSI